MADTIVVEPNAEVVIPAPGTSIKEAASDASLKEMQTMVEKRYGKKPDATTADPKKPDASREHGIPELRKSRDEAIEKIKSHEKTLAERDTELTGLRKQVTEFDGTLKEHEALKARVATAEQERDKYKKLDSIAAWENDPDTQKKYTEGGKKAADRLRELATLAEIDPDELVSAAGKTGKDKIRALDELLGGASRFVTDDIVQTVRFMEELAAERADELANVEQRMQERRANKETADRQSRAERAAVRDTAWKVTSELLAKDIGLPEPDIAKAGEFFKTNKDAGKAAEITLKGHAFDAVRAENIALKAELAKYDKASPGVHAGVGTNAVKVDVKAERRAMIAEVFPARG